MSVTTRVEPKVLTVSRLTKEEFVQKANEVAEVGDAVLLSPACASFDMFSGYEQRGDVFIAAVREVLQ